MRMTLEDATKLGQAVVSDDRLMTLRTTLGITRAAMAELLHTSPVTYARWEKEGGNVTLRKATALRVGRFYHAAVKALELIQSYGYDPSELIPFHLVATQLGIPQEQLLERYRNGEVDGIDAGILGLWLHKSDLQELKHYRR